MRAGTLRHRVRIDQYIETRNSFGEEVRNWGEFATVWAAVEPLSGRERYEEIEAQILAIADHRVRLRYRTGLHHRMRVVWRDRTFDVKHVANVGTRDREIHLLCEEQPDGA